MNDKMSKKEFNNSMRELDRQESQIDKSMSKYYHKPIFSGVDILYHSTLIALNVVFWVIVYLYLYNTVGVDMGILASLNNIPIYIAISAIGIVLCRVLSNMIVIKMYSRYTRPVASFRLAMRSALYSKLTYAGFIVNEYTLTRSRVGTHTATTIDDVLRIGEYVFIVFVSLVMSILFILYVDISNVLIAVFAMLSSMLLLVLGIVFVSVMRNEDRLPVVVFRFCKMLYVLKLVKDVDYAYQVLSLKVITMSRVLKNIKHHISSMLISIVSCVFRLGFRAFVIYSLLGLCMSVGYLDFVKVIVYISVIDTICYVYPPKNKVVVKDILVLSLFSTFVISEYLFVFGVLYILVDYYIPVLVLGVYDILDRLLLSRVEPVLNKSVSNKRMRSIDK